MYSTVLAFIKFSNFGTQCLNGPRHLFHSFCCTTQHIFEPLRVYEPGFNMDKYSMHVCLCVYVRACACVYVHVCVCMTVCACAHLFI